MQDAIHHDHDDHVPIPRAALLAAAALVSIAIAAAGFARVSGLGRSTLVETSRLESRALFFEDRADGAVVVRDAADRGVVDVLEPGSFGFVRVAMRGLARDRRLHGVGAQTPFMLTRWSDNHVTLDDPETGRRLDLAAFGHANAEAFERLLHKKEEAKQ